MPTLPLPSTARASSRSRVLRLSALVTGVLFLALFFNSRSTPTSANTESVIHSDASEPLDTNVDDGEPVDRSADQTDALSSALDAEDVQRNEDDSTSHQDDDAADSSLAQDMGSEKQETDTERDAMHDNRESSSDDADTAQIGALTAEKEASDDATDNHAAGERSNDESPVSASTFREDIATVRDTETEGNSTEQSAPSPVARASDMEVDVAERETSLGATIGSESQGATDADSSLSSIHARVVDNVPQGQISAAGTEGRTDLGLDAQRSQLGALPTADSYAAAPVSGEGAEPSVPSEGLTMDSGASVVNRVESTDVNREVGGVASMAGVTDSMQQLGAIGGVGANEPVDRVESATAGSITPIGRLGEPTTASSDGASSAQSTGYGAPTSVETVSRSDSAIPSGMAQLSGEGAPVPATGAVGHSQVGAVIASDAAQQPLGTAGVTNIEAVDRTESYPEGATLNGSGGVPGASTEGGEVQRSGVAPEVGVVQGLEQRTEHISGTVRMADNGNQFRAALGGDGQAGAVQAGAVQARAVQAGAVQAGAVQAGAVQAGVVRSDAIGGSAPGGMHMGAHQGLVNSAQAMPDREVAQV